MFFQLVTRLTVHRQDFRVQLVQGVKHAAQVGLILHLTGQYRDPLWIVLIRLAFRRLPQRTMNPFS